MNDFDYLIDCSNSVLTKKNYLQQCNRIDSGDYYLAALTAALCSI
jgi:tRNA A37 threonylcarbamoyladenosine dehydratase